MINKNIIKHLINIGISEKFRQLEDLLPKLNELYKDYPSYEMEKEYKKSIGTALLKLLLQ